MLINLLNIELEKRDYEKGLKISQNYLADPNTIMTLISTTIAVGQVVAAVVQWQKNKKVVVNPKLDNPNKELGEINNQIQALLEKMKGNK